MNGFSLRWSFPGFFLILVAAALPFLPLYAEPDPNGREISKDVYANIPDDMQVKKVASNVITPESDTAYLARKFDAFEKQWLDYQKSLEQRLEILEQRIQTLEQQKTKSHV